MIGLLDLGKERCPEIGCVMAFLPLFPGKKKDS